MSLHSSGTCTTGSGHHTTGKGEHATTDLREQRVKCGAELGRSRQNDFDLSSPACVDDLPGGALSFHGNTWQRIRDAEPGIFSTVLTFEVRIAGTARPHQARANGGYDDAVFVHLCKEAP